MELNVGYNIREEFAINIEIYFRTKEILSFLNDEKTSISVLKDLPYDTRISKEDWKLALHKELIQLFQWATKRIIYSNNSQRTPLKSAYIFLPYYGITLHVIRRVMPFILLNFKTNIIISEKNSQKTTEIINSFFDYLGVQDIPILSKKDFGEIDEEVNRIMFFTGKKSNLNSLIKEYTKSIIFGATGEHAICLFKNNQSFQFKPKEISPSCTNLKHKFKIVGDTLIDTNNKTFELNIVKRINPTVIYTDFDFELFPEYKTVNINEKDINLIGLCADPINGYHGDYKI